MDRNDADSIFLSARKHALVIPEVLKVESMRFGDWSSEFSDDGLVFTELREYEPGDKLRDIHLPSYFQNKELMTTRYEATRQLDCLIVMDMTASMKLRNKLETATAAFSRIFYSMLDMHVPTHLWIIGDSSHFSMRANMNVSEYWFMAKEVFADIAANNATNEQNHNFDEDDWKYELDRKSLIFFISDFLAQDEDNILGIIDDFSDDYRLIPIVVQDEFEYSFLNPKDLPRLGATVSIGDVEKEFSTEGINLTRHKAREIKDLNEARFAKLSKEFKERNLNFVHLKEFEWPLIHNGLQEALDILANG